MPILAFGVIVFFICHYLNLLFYYVAYFVQKIIFRNYINDIKDSAKGTFVEKKINETINKFRNEEE